MGYRAASTCEMHFDGATAWLVGEPNRGLAAMFTMVNVARLLVAMQGLGTSEAAYQAASAYALERRQGRALSGPAEPDQRADRLIVHPDVRRMLLSHHFRGQLDVFFAFDMQGDGHTITQLAIGPVREHASTNGQVAQSVEPVEVLTVLKQRFA